MSATTYRNAVRRREHYERHQPAARQRFGLLEKHKDYVKRAKNYHDKEKRTSELRKKAANRNPDEFYFGMHGAKTKRGVHKAGAAATEQPRLTADMLQVLKTQDKTYVQMQLSTEVKKVERLRASLHDPRAAQAQATHETFHEHDEGGEEDDALSDWDPLEDVEAPAAAAAEGGAGSKRKRVEEASEAPDGAGAAQGKGGKKADRKQGKRVEKARRASYAELEARQGRVQKLSTLAAHMQLSQQLLQKGKRVKIAEPEGEQPAVYMWKPQRKR